MRKQLQEVLAFGKNAGQQADSGGNQSGELYGMLRRKLCSQCGETLTETLCAVLIAALAAALLAVMSGTAARLNDRAIERDTEIYQLLTAAESGSAESKLPAAGTVTVTVKADTGAQQTVTFTPVSFYGEDGTLASYRLEAEAQPE